MKKRLIVILALCLSLLFAGCTPKGASSVSQSVPAIPSPAPVPAVPEAPPPSETEAPLFTEADVSALLVTLVDSQYVYWAIDPLPADEALRTTVVNHSGYGVPLTLISVALWHNNGAHGEGLVSTEELRQAALDLYGVDYSLQNAPEDTATPGYYAIPAHGPTHSAELLPETAYTGGNAMHVDTLVSYWYYEEGVYRTITLRHTFTKNGEDASFPYRLVSLREVASTGQDVGDGVTQPVNLYPDTRYGLVTVEELNVRKGPGTEYEKSHSVYQDNLLFLVGDDGGEWLCTFNGWVSAEYVTVLGSASD